MSTSSPPAWFSSVADNIVAGLPSADQAQAAQDYAAFGQSLATASPDQVAAFQQSFISGAISGSLNSALDGLDSTATAGITSEIAGVRTAVGQASSAILTATNAALQPLQDAANALRSAADQIWSASRTASTTARSLRKAEQVAAVAAAVTGSPGVTAAWAAATQVREAAALTADAASQAGQAADTAWGAVVRVIDIVRESVFDVTDSVNDIVTDLVNTVAAGDAAASQTAYSNVDAVLRSSFASVIGGGA